MAVIRIPTTQPSRQFRPANYFEREGSKDELDTLFENLIHCEDRAAAALLLLEFIRKENLIDALFILRYREGCDIPFGTTVVQDYERPKLPPGFVYGPGNGYTFFAEILLNPFLNQAEQAQQIDTELQRLNDPSYRNEIDFEEQVRFFYPPFRNAYELKLSKPDYYNSWRVCFLHDIEDNFIRRRSTVNSPAPSFSEQMAEGLREIERLGVDVRGDSCTKAENLPSGPTKEGHVKKGETQEELTPEEQMVKLAKNSGISNAEIGRLLAKKRGTDKPIGSGTISKMGRKIAKKGHQIDFGRPGRPKGAAFTTDPAKMGNQTTAEDDNDS